ncbi:MAG TPA: hypothetical protein V6C99_09195 [Oculatellaceae cyanobacterium]
MPFDETAPEATPCRCLSGRLRCRKYGLPICPACGWMSPAYSVKIAQAHPNLQT